MLSAATASQHLIKSIPEDPRCYKSSELMGI